MQLHSYKFKKPGIRTQIVADMNKMIIFISESEKCGESNDGSMFLRMNLYNKLHIGFDSPHFSDSEIKIIILFISATICVLIPGFLNLYECNFILSVSGL